MNIQELQQHVRELHEAQGWPQTSLEQRIIFLMSEIGEIAREALELSWARTDAEAAQVKENLGMEMYDVVWNLCDLANILGIDLEAAFAKKAELNRNRKW